jgi:hypothetical protein
MRLESFDNPLTSRSTRTSRLQRFALFDRPPVGLFRHVAWRCEGRFMKHLVAFVGALLLLGHIPRKVPK